LATPHSDGLWCSIEFFFSIFLSVFLKLFHLRKKAFSIIAFAFWTLVNTFQMFYFLFKSLCMWCKSHLKTTSKFKRSTNFDNFWKKKILVTMGCWYNFQIWFAAHTNGCNPMFLLPWGVDTIFKFDLHHIQMDATQLSYCPWDVDVVSKFDLQHIQMDATQLSYCHGCGEVSRYDFNHMQMYVIQILPFPLTLCSHWVPNGFPSCS
jgi:hypothetical protein